MGGVRGGCGQGRVKGGVKDGVRGEVRVRSGWGCADENHKITYNI